MNAPRAAAAPDIHGERRPSPTDADNRKIGGLLVALAFVMTSMNLAAAVYLYRASAKVALVQKQLDAVSSFEENLKSKLDLVNTGIQGQFDKLNRSLPQNFNEINAGLSKLQGRLASQEADGASNADVETPLLAGGAQSLGSAEAPAGPAADAKPGAAPQMSPQPGKKPVPAASPSYQRIESADGLVRYKKIK